MDIYYRGREVLSSIKQAALSSFIFPISSGTMEDEMVCDPVHQLGTWGILTLNGYNFSRLPRAILGLHTGGIGQDIHVRKILAMAQMFLNQFIKVQGNYPARDFRTSGWVHPAQKLWWRDLKYFDADLRKLGLHEVARATCHEIKISMPNLFAIFKLYCPASGTFFTPVGELGLALLKWESNLPMGSMPYEEYFSCMMELEKMEKDNLEMFETYQELMCHFYICMDVHNARGNVNG